MKTYKKRVIIYSSFDILHMIEGGQVMFKKGGRFYIAVDLEGIACVIGEYGKGLALDTPGYIYAKKQATREANAAAKALFDGGLRKSGSGTTTARATTLTTIPLTTGLKSLWEPATASASP